MYRNPSNWPGEEGVVGSAQTRVATPLQAIGEIQSAIGSVTVRRDGGIVARVNVGDLVYQGDAIATGADGAVGIIFTDGTVFNLSSDGRAVLNEFAYDPNATSNSALLSLTQGTFAFIAGRVAKTGGLRIDTPVARIRGGDGGIGILTLAALTFSAIHETQAASRQEALLDDGIIARYGTFEITTRDGRVVLADDPGETIVIDPTGSVARIPNTSSRMAELQQAQQNAMATLSLGQQGGGPPGSSGNPFGDQAPQIFQLAPQPINNTVGPGGIGNDNTNLFKENFIFVPPPQAAPPPPAPIISLTAIAITNPSTAISIVNASAAHAGFPIIGTTSGVEDGRTVTITIVNSSNQVVYSGTTTVTNGIWLVEISSAVAKLIPDGSYKVTADTSDAAGNPAPQATKSVLVDTIAAAPTALDLVAASDSGSSSADKITNVTAPTVAGGGAEAGATVTLYDSDGTVLGTAVADASGNWTITSSPLSDGGHKLTATQFDLAGNASAISAALSVTIDTVAAAPSAPDMVAASDSFGPTGTNTDNITNNSTPTVSGSGAEAGATVTLYDTNGTTVLGTAVADASGNWTITSSPLSDGVHSLTATQTDIAGNTSVASLALSVTVDTVAGAPSAPDLIAASDSGTSNTDNVTSDNTPTVTGNGAEAGATVTLFDTDGTTVLGTAVADALGNWSITSSLLSDGDHSLTVKQTDIAGNTSVASTALSVHIDTTSGAPSAPDLIAASDSFGPTGTNADNITNDTTPTVAGGGAEAGATVTLYDTDGTTVLGTAVADALGNWTITSSPLSDGVHSLTVKQTDIEGNTSVASAGLSVRIDTVAAAPSAPDLVAASDSFGPTGTNTDNITNHATPTVTGNGAEAGATVTLYDTNGTTVLGTAVADALGNWTITSSPLSDGVHSLTATQTDIAGNTSVASLALSVTVDTVAGAPSAPDLIAASDSGTSNTDNVTSDNTPTVTGNGAEAGATVTLFDTDGTTVLGTAVADALGNWSITSSLLSDGDHSLTVKQTDIAGNTSVASTALSVHIDTTSGAPSAPDLIAASDSFGPTGTNADNITNDTTPTVAGGGAEAGATVTLYDTDGTTVLGTAVADALGNWTITSSPLSDGVHSLTVKQTDIEGNTSVASAGLSVRIDTVAAAPSAPDLVAASDSFGPTGTNTDNITNHATPTVSGSGAEAGATVTLYDTNGTTVLGTAVADALGNWTITSSPLSDGVHSLTATQTDIAGNTSVASLALSVTVDTVAGAPSAPDLIAASDSGTSNTDNVTSDNTPTVTGNGAEAGATVTLFDTDGTTVLGTAVADALGNWSITSSLLSDGDHSLTVKQTDIAGNTSVASTALSVHIDTTSGAPSAPDLIAASDSFGPTGTNADNITNDTTPTVAGGGAEAGATVTLYDTDGTTVLGTAVADALGNWTITSSPLSDGVHSLTVKQTDIEGNTSVASAGLSVRIDTVAAAPSAPDLVAASDSFGPTGTNTDNITNHATPTVTGNGAEAGATVTLYDTNGTTVLGTAVADALGNWTITSSPLSDGVHSLTATQTDIAGNTSVASLALSVTVDTVAGAPSAPDLIAASDSGTSNTDNVTSDNTPTVTGNGAEAGATVTLFDTDGTTVLGTAVADALGNWSITSSLLSDGDHSLTVKQTDIAGNTSVASTALSVHIDTTSGAPSAPDLIAASDSFGPTGTNADNITNDTTPTVAGGGAEAGATVTLYDTDGTTVLGTAMADALGNWTITSSPLSDGVHSLTVKQTDIEGNTSVASAGLSVRIDTVAAAPSAPDLIAASDSGSSSTDNITDDTTPTVTGSGAEAGATVTLYDTNGTTVLGTAVADALGNWTITSSPLSDGVHSLTVKQTDIAGNTSAASLTLPVTVDTTAPTIAINTIAGDDIVNGSEANAGFAISGTESGADGQAVTVKIVDSNGNVVDSYTTLAAGGAWSVSVTSAQALVLADGSYTVKADVSDAAGNSATEATRVITVPLTIDPGEVLVLKGDTLTGPIENNGTIQIGSNNTSTILGSITGTGVIEIKNNATLEIDGSVGQELTVLFSVDPGGGANAKLILDDPSQFLATIKDFTPPNDQIDLKHFIVIVPSTNYVDNGVPGDNTGGTLQLFGYLNGSTTVTEIDITFGDGDYTTANFKFTSDGNGGTLLNDPPTSTTTTDALTTITGASTTTTDASTTTTDATVTPVAETSTLTATTEDTQTNVTSVAVDDGTVGALDIAVDPDGGEMLIINGAGATAVDSGSLTLHGALAVDAGAFQLAIVPQRKRDDADGRHGDRANWNLQAASISIGAAVLFLVENGTHTIAEAATNGGLFAVENDIADTLSGSGSVPVNSDAALKFSTISHSISGALEVNDGRLEIANTASGTGLLKIDAGATPQFGGDDAVNVTLAGPTGELGSTWTFSDDGHSGAVVVHPNTGNHGSEPQSHELSSQAASHAPPEIPLATSNNGAINLSLPLSALNMEPGNVASPASEFVTEHLHSGDANTGNHGVEPWSLADHSSPALPSAANDIASQAAQDPGPPGAAPAGDHGKDSNPGHDGIGESHAGNTAHSDHSPPGLASAANDVASQAAQDPGPPGAAAAGDHGKDSNPGHDGIGESHAGNTAHSDHSPPGLASAANDVASEATQDPGPPSAAAVGDHGKDSNSGHGIGEAHAGNKIHSDHSPPGLASAANDVASQAAQDPGPPSAAAAGDHGKDSNSGHGIGESHAGNTTHFDDSSPALSAAANDIAPEAAQTPGPLGAAAVGDHGKDSNSGHDGIGESHAGDKTHSDQASLALPSGANNVAPQAAQDPGPFGAAAVGDHGKDSNSGHDGIGESHAGDKTLSDQPSPTLAAAANDPAPQAAQDPGSLGAAPIGDHAKDLFVFDANFGHDSIGQSHVGKMTQFDQSSPALSTAANDPAPQAAQDPGPPSAAPVGEHGKDQFVFDANFGDDGIGQSHAGNMTQFDQPSSALPTAANNVAPQAAQDPGPLGAAPVGDHAKDQFAFDSNLGHDDIGESHAGNMTQSDQPIFQTVSDILAAAEAHSAQTGLDPVAALGQNHDVALTHAQKDKPLNDFIHA